MPAGPLADWTENDWEMLLHHVEIGRVIPIVGRDLLRIRPSEDAPEELLYDYIARKLLEEHEGPQPPGSQPTLNDAVCRCLATRRVLPWHLPLSVRRILQELKTTAEGGCEVPKPLRDLVEIVDFPLFVSTTLDPLLQRAIECSAIGGRRRTPRVFSFDPKPATGRRVEDLPATVEVDPDSPIIYHLMGRLDVDARRFDPGNVVLSDEDTLEFVCSLLSENRERVPVNLLNELSRSQLLLLGCNFSDWLARFFLRAARRGRLSTEGSQSMTPSIQYVVDDYTPRDANLVLFVEQFWPTTRIYRTGNVVGFLEELNKRWKERNSDRIAAQVSEPADSGYDDVSVIETQKNGVFISYAREDEAAAKQVYAGLEGIPTWMDRADLHAGHNWDEQIEEHLASCQVFMPLISKNTNSRIEGYYFREWRSAVERWKSMHESARFIWPILIDDTRMSLARVPKAFHNFQWASLPGGKLSPEFRKDLEAYLASIPTASAIK